MRDVEPRPKARTDVRDLALEVLDGKRDRSSAARSGDRPRGIGRGRSAPLRRRRSRAAARLPKRFSSASRPGEDARFSSRSRSASRASRRPRRSSSRRCGSPAADSSWQIATPRRGSGLSCSRGPRGRDRGRRSGPWPRFKVSARASSPTQGAMSSLKARSARQHRVWAARRRLPCEFLRRRSGPQPPGSLSPDASPARSRRPLGPWNARRRASRPPESAGHRGARCGNAVTRDSLIRRRRSR